jgi:hypothetical protein
MPFVPKELSATLSLPISASILSLGNAVLFGGAKQIDG